MTISKLQSGPPGTPGNMLGADIAGSVNAVIDETEKFNNLLLSGFNVRGAWATATAYSVGDVWQHSDDRYFEVTSAYTSLANEAADIATGNVRQFALGYSDITDLTNAVADAEAAALSAQNAEAATVAELDGVLASINAITADPLNAVTAIWLPAQAFESMQGDGVLGKAASRLPAWLFPDGLTSSNIATSLQFPSHWATFRCVFVVTNTAANAGAPSMSCETHDWAIGDSINVTPSGGGSFADLPATPWEAVALNSGSISCDPSKTTTIRVARNAASVNDTLPNDVALLGVRLEKLT